MLTVPVRAGTVGVLLAAAGASSYGVTVVLGRQLAASGLGPATALGVRFGVAAGVLALVLAMRRVSLRPDRGEATRLLLLGGIGYTAESTLFFLALQQGTAAACALLFYSYPAVVLAVELARGRERVRAETMVALALATGGTALIVASGGGLMISGVGIVLALGSGVIYGGYLLVGRELGRRSDAMVAACWLAAGAAISSLGRGLAFDGLDDPAGRWAPLLGYGVATAAAFWLTFAAMSRIGAGRTAVVMTLEAVTAAGIAAVVLGEQVGPLQVIGGAGVLVAAALIGGSNGRPHRVRRRLAFERTRRHSVG